jgi:hypothetical protein
MYLAVLKVLMMVLMEYHFFNHYYQLVVQEVEDKETLLVVFVVMGVMVDLVLVVEELVMLAEHLEAKSLVMVVMV